MIRRLLGRCSATWQKQPGNLCRSVATGEPAKSSTGGVAELPEPWRSGFVPTAPVPKQQGHAGGATAFSWLRQQQPQLSLAALGKAYRQKQVRVWSAADGRVKRVSKSRVLVPGDVLLLPRELLGLAAADSNSGTAAAHHRDDHQQQPASSSGNTKQQQQSLQEQEQELAASALQHQPKEQQQQRLKDLQEQPEPFEQQQQQQQQQQHQHQQQQHQQRQRHPRQRGPLTVPQIRRWLLASSADIAVLLKPPGVLFDLPVADATALPIGNHLSNSSSNGSSGTSSSGSNLGDRSDQTPAHAHADSKLTADEQPGSQLPPDASTGAAAPDASTACVVAQALNIRPPQQPLLVHNNLPAGSSGALVLARHAAAAAWLRAYTAGEPAALAAPVIASLGGLQAAQEAVRRSASRAAAAAASAGKKGRQGASRRREQVLQDKQLQKLQQLAALAADSRQDQRSSRQEAHRGPGVSSSSRSRSNSSSSSRVREDAAVVDPLAQFDRRELKHWLQLYGEVGGLRLRRSFWAVVQGQLKPHQSGTLRDRAGGLRQQLCVTRYKVLASCHQDISWVELQPLTDSPDQVRRHCAQLLGAPVLGDTRFGYLPWPGMTAGGPDPTGGRQRQPRNQAAAAESRVSSGSDSSSETGDVWGDDEGELMLHAREVVLLRPAKPPVQVLAPVPKAMRAVLQSAGLM